MREGIGSIFLYNIIIVFIVLIFAFLAGTMSYAKAFRVNSKIINTVEEFEGYNKLSDQEIERVLNNYGYRKTTTDKCPNKNGMSVVAKLSNNYKYCLYYQEIDSKHIKYGVISYMYMDLPIIGELMQIPIYAETNSIYRFNG